MGKRLISPRVERIEGRLCPLPSDLGESICRGGSPPLGGDSIGVGDLASILRSWIGRSVSCEGYGREDAGGTSLLS